MTDKNSKVQERFFSENPVKERRASGINENRVNPVWFEEGGVIEIRIYIHTRCVAAVIRVSFARCIVLCARAERNSYY